MTLDSSAGRVQLTPQEYLACAAALRVSAAVAPAPELTPSAGNRKIETSTRRASAWWDAIVAHCPKIHQAGAAPPPLLAPVGGPHSPAMYGGGATVALQRGAAGIIMASLGMGESPQFRLEAVASTVAAVRSSESPHCPVVLPGALGPWEVLEAIAGGVDIVDSSFPVDCTEESVAITFRYWMPTWGAPQTDDGAPSPVQQVAATQDALTGDGALGSMVASAHLVTEQPTPPAGQATPFKFSTSHAPAVFDKASVAEAALDVHCTRRNAVSPVVAVSEAPLVPGCSCYSCQSHTAGYVRHLLNTSEMLGPQLLQVHNVHHWLQFAAAVRKAVAGGQLQEYIQWFVLENGGTVLTPDGEVTGDADTASAFKADSTWVQ